MNVDTLTLNGVEKSFSDWGFGSSVSGRKINQAADEFTATIINSTLAAEAATPTFPFESQIIVQSNRSGSSESYSDGTIKFQGKRVGQPMKGSAGGQGVTYKFQGPWYDLENTHYQQTYQGSTLVYTLAETVLFSYAQSYQSSGQEIYYGLISVGDQIHFILQWLLDQYAIQNMAAPFQFSGHAITTQAVTGVSASVDSSPTNNAGFFSWTAASNRTISPALFSLYLPTFITKPLTCADALKKCLEFSPRANIWFDHTTTPPTLHVTLPQDKRSVSLPLFDGVSHKSISILRRDDFLVRAVNIIYRIVTTINNSKKYDYVPDQCGPKGLNTYYATSGGGIAGVIAGTADPITGLRVLSELVDLSGLSETTVTGDLDCEPLVIYSGTGINGTGYEANTAGDLAAKRSWWASSRGGNYSKFNPEDTRLRFQDKGGNQTYIPDATLYYAGNGFDSTGAAVNAGREFTDADYNFYTSRIVRGTHHSWMTLNDGTPVLSVKARAKVVVGYAFYDTQSASGTPDTDTTTGLKHSNPIAEDHFANLELTNGVTSPYSAVKSSTPGEVYIVGNGGIAQFLYNQLSVIQYEGNAIHVASEFTDSTSSNYVDPGCVLNLTNGASEWAVMNAQIQSIEEDYFTHQTTVNIGLAKHLNVSQLNSLLQMWRNRREWYNPGIRTDSSQPAGGEVQMPVTGGNSDTTPGSITNGAILGVDYLTAPVGTTPGAVNGAINSDPTKVTAVLAATTPTPIAPVSGPDPKIGIKTIRPQERCVVTSTGQIGYEIHLTADPYTKP